MQSAIACRALRERRCLELRYGGYTRVVEVHAVGWSREGHGLMLAWQVRGGSASNSPTGWKKLRLDEASAAHLIDEPSRAPRTGYKRDDVAITGGIACQL